MDEGSPGASARRFVRGSANRQVLPRAFVVPADFSGRIVAAEFPSAVRALDVLRAIGSGERTFANIASKVGGVTPLPAGTLTAALRTLLDKRVIAVDEPLSIRPAPKERRYRIDDPCLRFWLRFVQPAMPEIERGRGDLAMETIEAGWTAWRGRAIEPVIRTSLARLLPDDRFPGAREVGGWWNRVNNPEVDLVGVDRQDDRGSVAFVGSIKWRERAPFDRSDSSELARVASSVPGWTPSTPLVAVSRSGVAVELEHVWGPDDLMAAWRRGGVAALTGGVRHVRHRG